MGQKGRRLKVGVHTDTMGLKEEEEEVDVDVDDDPVFVFVLVLVLGGIRYCVVDVNEKKKEKQNKNGTMDGDYERNRSSCLLSFFLGGVCGGGLIVGWLVG